MSRRGVISIAAALAAGPLGATEKSWLFLAGDFPGEAENLVHRDWIEVAGFSLPGLLPASQSGEFGIVKGIDRASSGIFGACAEGRVFDGVKIDLDAPVGDVVLCRLEFDNLIVSEVTLTGGADPVETVQLRYGAITYTYYLPDQSLVSTYDSVAGTGGTETGAGTDSDDDGMPDMWESAYGLTVGADDADDDDDGDGLSNRDEYLVGSHPGSGASFFKATAAPADGVPGQLMLSWNSVPGRRYEVLWSPDLATPFAPLAEITAAAATTTHPVAMGGGLGFYRVRLVP